MASDYVKIYQRFFWGSMRDAPPWPRLTFLAMLSMADQLGFVYSTPEGIAGYGAIPLEDIGPALELLTAPDPRSTSPEEDGRRIVEEGPNKWRIVNYRKYYELNRNEERREYFREHKRKQRAKLNGQDVPEVVPPAGYTTSGRTVGPAPSEMPRRAPVAKEEDELYDPDED